MIIGDVISKMSKPSGNDIGGLDIFRIKDKTEFRNRVWELMQGEFFGLTEKNLYDEIENNQTRYNFVKNIFKYLCQDSDSVFDVKKGLFLSGNIGVGKTTMLRVIRQIQIQIYREYGIKRVVDFDYSNYENSFYTASELVDKYTNGDYRKMQYLANIPLLTIDEVGRENLAANSFGNQKSVIADLLAARYQNKNNAVYTGITTNLNAEGFKDRYGYFILDRVKEMFNFIRVDGDSLR